MLVIGQNGASYALKGYDQLKEMYTLVIGKNVVISASLFSRTIPNKSPVKISTQSVHPMNRNRRKRSKRVWPELRSPQRVSKDRDFVSKLHDISSTTGCPCE